MMSGSASAGRGHGFTFHGKSSRTASPIIVGEQHTGRRASERRAERVLRRIVLALLFLIPLLQVALVLGSEWTEIGPRDATAYWSAAERVRVGEPLYESIPAGPHVPGVGTPYLYPPFLAALLSFVDTSHATFARMFLLLGLLCYWFYAACLARVVAGRFTLMGTLGWGAALMATFGAQGAISTGQIEPLIWALFGAALVFPGARGAMLTLGTAIKLYALWPLGLALWVERRRVIVSALVAAVALGAFGVAGLGPRGLIKDSFTWLTSVYPTLAQGQFAYGLPGAAPQSFFEHVVAYFGNGNLSLGFLPLQLAHAAGWNPAGAAIGVVARAYLTVVGIGAPVATFFLFRKRSIELRLAAAMAAAVLFGPIFRSTYVPILFALLAAWLADRRHRAESARGRYRVAMR